MRHLYERNIIEIKSEYTNFLISILLIPLYNGMKSLYIHAVETEKKLKESLTTGNFTNPGLFKIFQTYLKDIETASIDVMQKEYERIKTDSKCNDWFDDLVRAVIKSHIVLLTYNVSEKTCRLIDTKYHNGINIVDFVHKCYIECSKTFYNRPEFVWHEYSKNTNICDTKKIKNDVLELIKASIIEAIRKMLPMKLILSEYLSNDYIKDDYQPPTFNKIEKFKEMIIADADKHDNNDKHDNHSNSEKRSVSSSVSRNRTSSGRSESQHQIKPQIVRQEIMSKILPKITASGPHSNPTTLPNAKINMPQSQPSLKTVLTENELDKINFNLNKLKQDLNSVTSDYTLQQPNKTDSVLNINIEHPILRKK